MRRLMRKIACAGLLSVAVDNASAQQQTNEERVLLTTEDSAGRTVELRVTEKQLAATRPWVPERQPPPLSIAAAVTAAKKRVKPERPADLYVVGIQLQATSIGTASNPATDFRWYYIINMFDLADSRNAVPPMEKNVAVLMDGSVVTPVVPASPAR
ncbi:MAG TPA: hypothetical protein VN654_23430 [Vicinamibacterales bacterium]|jgi:hypothetical protein|nr:hypothetical protein [Vicinamibacterales bacterium]